MAKQTTWMLHVAKIRKENPKVKGPAIFKLAKKSYSK